jgi:hypothetical protein
MVSPNRHEVSSALTAFARLSPSLRAALILWISVAYVSAKSTHRSSSYTLKHAFVADGGLYVSSEAFAGAMISAGHPIAARVPNAPNYFFKVRSRVRRHAVRAPRYLAERETLAHGTPEERRAFVALIAAANNRLENAA